MTERDEETHRLVTQYHQPRRSSLFALTIKKQHTVILHNVALIAN